MTGEEIYHRVAGTLIWGAFGKECADWLSSSSRSLAGESHPPEPPPHRARWQRQVGGALSARDGLPCPFSRRNAFAIPPDTGPPQQRTPSLTIFRRLAPPPLPPSGGEGTPVERKGLGQLPKAPIPPRAMPAGSPHLCELCPKVRRPLPRTPFPVCLPAQHRLLAPAGRRQESVRDPAGGPVLIRSLP